MKIFNTNTQPQKLTIPTVELINFEEISIHEKNQTDTKTNLKDRNEFNFSQRISNNFINQISKVNDYDQSFTFEIKIQKIPLKNY